MNLGLFDVFVIGAILMLVYAYFVGRQARQRGYSPWIWGIFSFITMNPLLVMILLAILPDKHKQNLRETWLTDLRARLPEQPLTVLAAGESQARAVRDVSLGDLPTSAPSFVRSLGDEETRLP